MTVIDWLEVFSLLVLLAISTPLLGNYMVRVYSNGPAPGDRVFLPMENFVYRICRIDPKSEQRWRSHLVSMLVWTLVGGLLTYFVFTGAKVVGMRPLRPLHRRRRRGIAVPRLRRDDHLPGWGSSDQLPLLQGRGRAHEPDLAGAPAPPSPSTFRAKREFRTEASLIGLAGDGTCPGC